MKLCWKKIGLLAAAAALVLPLLLVSGKADAVSFAVMRDQAVAAYKVKNYSRVVAIYDSYLKDDGPQVGRIYALLAFMRGHAGYELFKKTSLQNYQGDYDREIIIPLTESLKILRTDIIFKYDLLGRAYFDKLRLNDFRDQDSENNTVWYLWDSLNMRYEDVKDKPRTSSDYTTFCKYLIVFVNNCMEIVENIDDYNIYSVRIRNAVKLGFGSVYDERFWQLYEMTFFDKDNIKAGVLWQKGLDLMVSKKASTDEVINVFKQAINYTRGTKEKAELYRQMSDITSQIDETQRKLEAVEYGQMAYSLDPLNPDIRRQYGSALHILSYSMYNQARFAQAMEYAKRELEFDWQGDEVAYWDMSRVMAEYGNKFGSIKHAKRAYEMARQKYTGAEFAPYLQNYVNILRQFGEARRATQVEHTRHYTK